MALRDYKYDQEKVVPLRPSATYNEYQAPAEDQQSVEEILFFINIAIFAIASVLTIFMLSALKINTVLAFILGIGSGVLTLQICRIVLKKYKHNHSKAD